VTAEVVRTEGLVVRHGATTALAGVDLSIPGPGLVVILGPNGAGKTTLLDVLLGLAAPDEGSVLLFGEPATPSRYPRRRVGAVLQRELVIDRVTVGEYAEIFAAIQGVRGGAARILERSGLASRATVALDRISGGEAARLFIAAATVHDPAIVFLDEPTASLDPGHKAEIGLRLVALARKATVVMATHDLAEAERIADDLVFLTEGKVRARGPREKILREAGGATTLADAFFFLARTRIGDRGDARS
jgi:ABC-2 type transport system ATP-binding protein